MRGGNTTVLDNNGGIWIGKILRAFDSILQAATAASVKHIDKRSRFALLVIISLLESPPPSLNRYYNAISSSVPAD